MSEPTKPRLMLSRRAFQWIRGLEVAAVIGALLAMGITGTIGFAYVPLGVLMFNFLVDRQATSINNWQRAQWSSCTSVIELIMLDASTISRIEKVIQLPSSFKVQLQNKHSFTLTTELWAQLGPGLRVNYEVRELDNELEFRNITAAA